VESINFEKNLINILQKKVSQKFLKVGARFTRHTHIVFRAFARHEYSTRQRTSSR